MAVPTLNAKVKKKIIINPNLMILQVAPDGWDIPDFKPGQYCAMGLPGSFKRHTLAKEEAKPTPEDKLINRAYSLSSAPQAKNHLEIYITMVPDGSLTPRLFALEEGDGLWVSPKIVGHFNLEGVPEDANVILISTGTGLAPYMSMLRSGQLNLKEQHVAVLHGVRQSYDLGYRDELENMVKEYPNFFYVPTVSRPQNEKEPWNGKTGYVQELWKSKIMEEKWKCKLSHENTHVFLCGGPGMIDGMIEILNSEGFVEHTSRTPGQIHVERYW